MIKRQAPRFRILPCIVLCVLVTSGVQSLSASGGRLVYQSVYSKSLSENLLGDAAYRSVIVYLPAAYDLNPEDRFPTVYLLHGYNDTNTVWRDGAFQGFELPASIDHLIDQGKIRPMLLVFPDARNAYGGSYYTNSEVTGNWEEFVVSDLVSFIDTRFRTVPSAASRGLGGHSMGGYGALYLSMRHPEIFSVAYGLSACCLAMLGDVTAQNPEWITTIGLRTRSELLEQDIYPNAFISLSAALSPNPNSPPFFVQFPFLLAQGRLVPNPRAYQRWLEHFPAEMVRDYGPNLKKLSALAFDVGKEDRFSHILLGSRALAKALADSKIPFQFEEFEGDHTNRLGERLRNKVLPFFSSKLSPLP